MQFIFPSRGVLFQVLSSICCEPTPARIRLCRQQGSKAPAMRQEAWCLKSEQLVIRVGQPFILLQLHPCGEYNKPNASILLPRLCCDSGGRVMPNAIWPWGFYFSTKARNILYQQHSLFIPSEETLAVVIASHQSADGALPKTLINGPVR